MIETAVYSESAVRYPDANDADALATARDADGTTWVNASEATDDELSLVADVFGIHPLSIEDVRSGARPKTEMFPEHTFVLVTTARFREGDTSFDEALHTRSVGLCFGDDWLVTMATDRVSAVERVWGNVDRGDGRMLRYGPDYTASRVVDVVVDGYFEELDAAGDSIEAVEESVLERPDPATLERLNDVRRDLLSLRKVLWPTREAVAVLARGDPDHVREATEKYYRDVYDHLVQLVDLVETYRDLTAGTRDIYLNVVSQSTNEVMKTLTVVATILLPLTFVVGVFGMNFADGPFNMPELSWPYAYPAVILGMAGVALVMLLQFSRREWL